MLILLPVGYPVAWDWIADNIKRGQDYLVHNTTLGIPAIVQTEGMFLEDAIPGHVLSEAYDTLRQVSMGSWLATLRSSTRPLRMDARGTQM
jgi:hypothetical protein